MSLAQTIKELKALVNEDTLLPMMFLGLRKLGNICCGHKMFLNKVRNIFCVPDTKFGSATNVARAGKPGNSCVGNNVSSFARAFKAMLHVAILQVARKIASCNMTFKQTTTATATGTSPNKRLNEQNSCARAL